jgi:hypothetical protein
MPLPVWFSSDRGRPRTRSSLLQVEVEAFHVRRDTMPEFVSRFLSVPLGPPPIRGSLDVT